MFALRAFALMLCTSMMVMCSAVPGVAEQNLASTQPSAVTSTAATAQANRPTTIVLPSAAPESTTLPPTLAPAPTAPAAPAPTDVPPAAATKVPVLVAPTVPVPTDTPLQPTSVTRVATNEILFLRKGTLIALDPAKSAERTIIDNVSDFRVAANNRTIGLVRGSGAETEIWIIERDGSGLVQITDDERVEAVPSLAADGSAIVFAASGAGKPYARIWPDWGQWCAASEVRLVELATNEQRTLGQGCDPAFGPDGKRIAFATPPTSAESDFPHSAVNTVRMINRQGQNGWTFASAGGSSSGELASGLLVYAPAWSPDGSRLVYHRFLGYQALVDVGMSELSVAFRADGRPVYSGAGWQLPPRFAPNGARVAITEDNYSDARGFGGYDNWAVTVIPLEGTRVEALPQGEVTMIGAQTETLRRAQGGAWSPEGAQLAVVLPSGWKPELPNNEPINNGEEAPGELWLWTPGSTPQQRLAADVDFASPVVWLP